MESFPHTSAALIERARWKNSDWDKPTPPKVLKRYAHARGTYGFHLSEIGPGGEVRTPSDARGGMTDPKPAGGFKVGINPSYHYNTPLGVYAYPLTPETYERRVQGRKPKGDSYATDRPWMYVLEAEGDGVTVDGPDTSGWSEGDMERACRRLVDLKPKAVIEAAAKAADVPREQIGPGLRAAGHPFETELFADVRRGADPDDPFTVFYDFAGEVAFWALNGAKSWGRLLRKAGEIGWIADLGTRLIDTESKQIVFLDSSAFESVDVVENVWDWRARKSEGDLMDVARATLKRHGLADELPHVEMAASGGGGADPEAFADALDHPAVQSALRSVSGDYTIVWAGADGSVGPEIRLEGAGPQAARVEALEIGAALARRLQMRSIAVVGAAVRWSIEAVDADVFVDCAFRASTIEIDRTIAREAVGRDPLAELEAEERIKRHVSGERPDDGVARFLEKHLGILAGCTFEACEVRWTN